MRFESEKILMTDYAQIATIEEELEWEEWKGVRLTRCTDYTLLGYTVLAARCGRKHRRYNGTRRDVSTGYD